ncbi:MAG: hypothetical protein ABMA64_21485 [Myxococcota bacterium]
MRITIGAVLAAACTGQSTDDAPALLDTGWFTTTPGSVDPLNCPDQFVTWAPEDGVNSWYWRDRPVFYTASTNRAAYEVWLQDASGARVPATSVWDEQTGLSFTLDWDGFLAADTDYTLGLTDCAQFRTITFHTSPFGQELAVDPGALIGNTYLLDLVGAEWVEPPILGGLMQTYFQDPILLGIRHADDVQIDLLAAPGKTDDFGVVRQNLGLASWDFPLADFRQAPYLDAPADSVTLTYDSTEIQVSDFLLQATFSADGSRLGGGTLSGLADSRNLGTLLGSPDDQGLLCELAAGVGVPCQPCPDGQPYCLFLRAIDLEGELLPGVTLVQTDG